MNVLITGANGFVGRNLAKHLSSRFNILSTDIVGNSLKMDVTRYEEVLKFFREHNLGKDDLIIHLAAKAGNRPSYLHPREYLFTNIVGTLNIISAMKETGVQNLIFLSAWNVVGPRVALPMNENDPINPDNPYGVSKAVCEKIINLYSSLFGIKSIILRPCIVYGPDQEEKNTIQQVIDSMLHNKIFDIYCKGEHSREYLFIDDLCSIIDSTTEYLGKMKKACELFLLGTEKPYSVNDVVRIARSIKDFKTEYVEENTWCFSYYSDITKAKREMGIDPSKFMDLRDGMLKCYEYKKWRS